jgi:transcriptional repressor NF-X1
VLGPMWKACLFVIFFFLFLISYFDRLFDCESHKCQQPCHPPSRRPVPCPSSPSKITHCPCGKRPIAQSPIADADLTAFPARSRCTSPIPTCTSSCDKPHLSCGHPCGDTCHTGPCPPCSFSIVRPCRCGVTTRPVRCYELHPPDGGDNGNEVMEILCEKLCAAFRTCGRHQCRRPCCPLASLASAAGKRGKKRTGAESGVGEEQGGLHECDLVCGKLLSCGDHRCEEKDHKGACPPCLRSSFEEVCPPTASFHLTTSL